MSEKENIPNKKLEDRSQKSELEKEKTGPTSGPPAALKPQAESEPQPELKPQTSDVQPETTSMEVHKHPHDVTHKKKWGEYLLEFSMLFLAVFLGFLAEN